MQTILKVLPPGVIAFCLNAALLNVEARAEAMSETACMPLAYGKRLIPNMVTVSRPGKFCLVQDFVQWKRSDWTSGQTGLGNPEQDGIIYLGFGNLDIDLAGHALDAGPYNNVLGISLGWLDNRIEKARYQRNIRIHNGSIKVPGPGGVGIDLNGGSATCLNTNQFTLIKGTTGICPFEDDKQNKYRARIPFSVIPPYDKENYLIENMTIHAGGRAVAIGGANTILRNNTLEVDGHTAVVLYGPNALIENNTFIVHLDRNIPVPTLSAIIKLRDADGAVIRNNRFIVKPLFPWSPRAPAAINLLESNNVLIEDNTLEGVESLVRKDAASRTGERGNVFR